VGPRTVPAVPGHRHQAFVELFLRRPELAAELLRDVFGIAVPAHGPARAESADLTGVDPVELRADVVVVLPDGDRPVFAVVVEAQMRPDVRKRRTWPAYLTAAALRGDCPAALLVVCPDDATAAWCRTPIPIGHPGLVLTPLVLGPALVPVIDDPGEAARAPELAVMSAVAHGADPARTGVLDALVSALSTVDVDRANLYADIVLAALPQAAHRYLEALMRSGTYEYQSDFARRYVAEGRAEGRARAVLAVLEERDLDVPSVVRERVLACSDPELLDALVRRAVTVASAEDLFDQLG